MEKLGKTFLSEEMSSMAVMSLLVMSMVTSLRRDVKSGTRESSWLRRTSAASSGRCNNRPTMLRTESAKKKFLREKMSKNGDYYGLTVRCCDLGRKGGGGGFQAHTFKEYIILDENFLFGQILNLMKSSYQCASQEEGTGVLKDRRRRNWAPDP